MTPYITTRAELQAYIERKLGGETHTVEISTNQWTDILEDSLKYFFEYSDDGSDRKLLIVEPAGATELTLDNSVLAITEIFGTSGLGQKDLAYFLGSSYVYQVVQSPDSEMLSSYAILNAYLADMKKVFSSEDRVQFDFNPETKKLTLYSSEEQLVFEILEESAEGSVLNHKLLKKLVEGHAWLQWATNVGGKYKSVLVGNGMELAVDEMRDKGEKLLEEVKEEMNTSEYGGLLGVMKL